MAKQLSKEEVTKQIFNGKTFAPFRPKGSVATLAEIEEQIWVLEGIRVVFRAPSSLASPYNDGKGYSFERRLSITSCVAHLRTRIGQIVPTDIPFEVYHSSGRVLEGFENSLAIAKISALPIYAKK